MKYISILLIPHFFTIIRCEISDSLREYIETNKRLQKYSVTKYVDYEKNQTSFVEEHFYLNWKDSVLLEESSQLKDRILNVSVFHREDHEFDCCVTKNSSNNGSFIVHGYSIDILNTLQNILNFKVQFNLIENFNNVANTTIEQELLSNSTIDLILCHPEINIISAEVLHPTMKSSYVLIYKPSNLSFTQDIFILTFAGTLWLCFIIILILLAVSLRISTRQYNRIYAYPQWGTVEITFWAIATACQQGLSSIPFGFASRLIIFLGAMAAYLLYTGFAAGITSLVAVQNENVEVTVKDIEDMNLNVISFGSLRSLPLEYDYLTRHAVDASNMKTFFERLDEKRWIGVTLQIFLDQYLSRKYSDIDRCSYVSTVLTGSRHTMSNLVSKHSRLKKIFNYWLLRKAGAGLWRGPRAAPELGAACGAYHGGGYTSARLEQVRSAVALLAVGIGLATFIALTECIWHGYRLRRARRHQHQPPSDPN